MSHREKSTTQESFEQSLARLRRKIDLLPAEQRPHLYELADVVERQQRRLGTRGAARHDAR